MRPSRHTQPKPLRRTTARRVPAIAVLLAVALALGSTGVASGQVGPVPTRIDLRVLVLDDGSESVDGIVQGLERAGVPHTAVALASADRPTVDGSFLSRTDDGQRRGFFQAVVVPDAALTRLDRPGEVEALHDYERAFDVRQVNAYQWPNPTVGLDPPAYTGVMDGAVATVLPAGRAAGFGYLAGQVPLDDGSYGYVSSAPAGGTFTSLVDVTVPSGASGSLIGVHAGADGREELVITASSNAYQLHGRALVHGVLSWASRGVHLGLQRSYLSVHVDDVLLPDDRWSIEGNCTPGDSCGVDADGEPLFANEVIRMTAADVDHLRTWQQATGIELDLAFNAFGEVEERATKGADPLTDALLATPEAFRWINHTWSHPWLGCIQDFAVVPWQCRRGADGAVEWVDEATLTEEIAANQRWAVARGVPMDPSELITGQHSGLRSEPVQAEDNPGLPGALGATGITVIASDASREREPRMIGGAVTLPRYPMNIFYNVATEAEEVDEYNWIYTSSADGGSGVCEVNPFSTCIEPLDLSTGFDDHIAPLEATIALGHVLGNDPRPHFVHQSNLAEDRIIYPVVDQVLGRYRALYADSAPIVVPTMTEAAEALVRQVAWADQLVAAPDAVQAYTLDGVLHVEASPTSVDVPVTAPIGTTLGGQAFGEVYASAQSGWVAAAAVPPTTVPPTTVPPTTVPPTTVPPTTVPPTTVPPTTVPPTTVPPTTVPPTTVPPTTVPPTTVPPTTVPPTTVPPTTVPPTTVPPTTVPPTTVPPTTTPPSPAPGRSGYWMVGAKGKVYAFGDARWLGDASVGSATVVDIEATPDHAGYWVVDDRGMVHRFGTARTFGGVPGLAGGERVTSLSATPSGRGYWLFTSTGRTIARGDAVHLGDREGKPLNGPVLDSIATPGGDGYYLVASDGGVFSYGTARFRGSMGGRPLNRPVRSLSPDPDGDGYWLVAADGGVFAFGAPFRGSMGDKPLNRPVVGMVPYGDGYLMVASDGGIFSFSDRPFRGSLGADPPAVPVVSVAALDEVAG